MIPIVRTSLTPATMRTLRRRQAKVDESADPAGKAVKGWKTFRGKARMEVLDQLQEMCSGFERCMYCEDNMATDIEHFRPKAVYPDVAYVWDNYLLACSHCNSNIKRDQFPVKDGRHLLIDPTAVDPFDHIAFSPTTGRYVPLDNFGAASIDVFGLNRDVCVNGRISAWTSLCALIRDFEQAPEERRDRILTAIRNFPFQGVRRWMVSFLVAGDDADAVPADVRDIFRRWPELAD